MNKDKVLTFLLVGLIFVSMIVLALDQRDTSGMERNVQFYKEIP